MATEKNFYFNVDVTDATANVNSETLYGSGENVRVEVVANKGYYFDKAPTIEYMDDDGFYNTYRMYSDDTEEYKQNFYYDFTFPDEIQGDVVDINGKAQVMPVPEKNFYFNVNVTDATANVNSETLYGSGENVRVEVVANEGYYFATAPTIKYLDYDGNYITYIMDSDDTEEYKQNFYYDFTFPDEIQQDVVDVNGNAQVIPDTDKYGIITIYNPTPTELKQIGEVRYMKTGDSSIDLGDYITNLIKVYVKIPKGKTANVVLGGYNTKVVSNAVVTDVIETDCGTVEIVGNYNNVMDYENTTIEIYLPLIGFQPLEPEKVMNETLSLVYKTNVINGDTIACIYNTTGTLLYTFNTNASFEIPYRLNKEIEAKGVLEVNSNYLFGFTPFITVRYNKAYNTANVIANDNRETFIKNETGYIKCSEVFNTVNATATEKEEIENLLKEGVLL